MKLHLCCGDVYLRGYENIDTVGNLVSHVQSNPNETDLEHYYIGSVHDTRPVICDRIMNLPSSWDYPGTSLDEVLMICALEHFSHAEAIQLIDKIHYSLKDGGIFRFDVPDLIETVLLNRNRPDYMVRLIYGSGKNKYGFHRWGYTRETLNELLLRNDWKSIKFGQIVKHDYPMIGVTATK